MDTELTIEPQTWHYGLVARWWAEFNTDGPEIAYFQDIIERFGQPALDVACGTGRLLLPFLRAGLDVDGSDISPDMLALCREKAEREGLAPRLYQQATHELDLPRRYKTLVVCGSFGIGGVREHDLEALRRFYQHLEPGGVLVFDGQTPYGWIGWNYWLRENRSQLPKPWAEVKDDERKRLADGTELELRSRWLDLDPLEQVATLQMRAEQWRGDQLLAQEDHTLKSCLYFKNEQLMMLEQAGFQDITVYGAYTEVPATADDDNLIFLARK